MSKITFGKFEGPLRDEGVKDIFVDGVEVGHIERQIVWDYSGARTGTEGKVVGYQLNVFDGPEAASPLLPLDSREFKTLGDAQRAVRDAYAAESGKTVV